MEIIYSPKAIEDRAFWKKSGNKSIQKKISELLDDIELHPFTGIGQPEALKHELSGKWSRRINKEHRLVYEIDEINDYVFIHSLKGHY
ncbi:MAG: Txe/YoeB family addiction module toxin [Chitinophagaceae bacterium]